MEIKVPDVFLLHSTEGKIEAQMFHLQAGQGTPAHKHESYTHDALIVKGRVKVTIGSIEHILDAPSQVSFPQGTQHSFEALVDGTEILTAHPTWQP